ncbi:MAG: hypothetical protein WAU89_13460 [Candidatus Acidiferrales bacterium]
MRLLIAIPTKTGEEYQRRLDSCQLTWLRNCPCDWLGFTDEFVGIDSAHPLVRQQRMKLICRYALAAGYDFLFRVDSDAYVRVDRLLKCGFEAHDYMGWHKTHDVNAFGSVGFFLSRRAMQVVVDAKHFPQAQGIYWGDMWTGYVLRDAGIDCHVHAGFVDGLGTDFTVENLPPGEWISIHPVSNEEMVKIHGQ